MYVGRDFRRLRELERQMPASVPRVQLGAAIQQQGTALRRPFLQFMADQMVGNDTAVIWSSGVFENNTVDSPLFLNLCSLGAIESYLCGASPDFLLIVAERAEMVVALQRNLPKRIAGVHIEVTWRESVSRVGSWLHDMALILCRPIVFLLSVLWERLLTRLTGQEARSLPEGEGWVILRTWVQGSWFDKKGGFEDRYLPNLAEWLTSNGFRVLRLPVSTSSFFKSAKIVRHLRNPRNTFLLPWDYLKVRDLVESLKVGIGQCRIAWKTSLFDGWDLDPLLTAQRRRYALTRRGLFAHLNGLLVRRLKERGIHVVRFIYTFENMLPEKPFILAVRQHFPAVPLIGFQHSALYPLKLDLYVDGRYINNLPLPDKVVCSGPLFRDILLREYAPFCRFADGPALRFAHLFDISSALGRRDRSDVLVVLPGYVNEATELMGKVIDCLMESQLPYPVAIKPHPLMSKEALHALIEELGGSALHLEIVTDPLPRLFQTSGAVITIASSVLLDALAAGIPVIRVRRESDLDMDPLDWMDIPKAFSFQATSPTELTHEIHRAMSLSVRQQTDLNAYAAAFVENGMGSLSNERFGAFVH